MTRRTMLGLGWSMLCGLAGGWLVLMPWALNVQGGGDWTTVTKVSFWTGLGLLAFCLIGLGVTGLLINQMLAPKSRVSSAEKAEQKAEQDNLDKALLQLASKLVADLDAPATHPAAPAPQPVAAAVPVAPQAPSAMAGGFVPQNGSPNGDAAPTWRRVEQ